MPGIPLGICVKASPPEEFLFGVERAMIGADGIDEAEFERSPEGLLIVFVAERRRHDVLHALHSRLFGIGFVEQEMGNHRFDGSLTPRRLARTAASNAGSQERWTTYPVAPVFQGTWRTDWCLPPPRIRGGWARATRDRFCPAPATSLQTTDQLGVLAMRGDDDAQVRARLRV